VQLVPQQLVVLLRVVSPVSPIPTLIGLMAWARLTTGSKSTLSLAGSPPDLDRRDDLGPELRAYGELDEAPRPCPLQLLTYFSLLSFRLTRFLIEERMSLLVRRT